MKWTTVVCLLAFTQLSVRAVIPVIDPSAIAHMIVSYATQVRQWLTEVKTQIDSDTIALKEIQQVEQQATELIRMGDPANYGVNMPGVGNITALISMYQAFTKDVADIEAFANPGSYTITAQAILSRYGITYFQPWTSPMGVKIAPAQVLMQFHESSFNVSQTTLQKIQALTQKKQDLTTQRDAAIAQLASASDQSAVQKQTALISALNAAIAGVDGQISQTYQAAELMQKQISAANGLAIQNNSLQVQQAFQQSMENDLASMTGVQGGTPQVAGNLQASDYGYVGDLTPDTNSANGIGNHDNQLIPYSSPGQVASAALSPNVASQYNLSVGQQFQFTTSNGTVYNLQYDDSTSSKLVNRVDIYAPNGQLGGNNFSAQGATISVGLPSKVQ